MQPYLPRDIIYRPKSGFGVPLRRWLRHELRELTRDALDESAIRRRGIFDPVAVARLVELNDEGRVDAGYTIFALVCIELWFRHFVDATPALTALAETGR
jgi:asparagine synthase (glutamine-hydrolysing)